MSNIVEYSSKATAVRGFVRAYGEQLDAAKFVVKGDNGKFGYDKDAADAALGMAGLSEDDQELKFNYGHVNCPHCGIHLSNGVTDFDGMVDCHGSEAAAYKLMKHEWMCLGCNGEWGAEIEAPKSKGSKAPTRHYENRSTIDGAVAKSHEIYNANPDARRKDAIQLAVDAGIAFYTARTQYQKWFKANKSKAK